MNPTPYVQLQAAATLLVSVLVAAILGVPGTAATAPALTVGLAIWAWFGIRYHRRRRAWPSTRSRHRSRRDRTMLQCFAVGLLVPAALSWAMVIFGQSAELVTPPVGDGQNVIVALCVVLIPLSILVSSSVDWYLIRAFREGVYGDPACRTAGTGQGADHQRYWVMHRFVCEVILWLAVTVGIAFVSAIAEDATSSESGKTMLSLIGILGIIGWSARELAKLQPALDFIRYPTGVGLGDWVTGRNRDREPISGVILDVALDPGVQLIRRPRGHPARDISVRKQCVRLADRDTLEEAPAPRRLCATTCEFWLPDCEVGLREREQRDPSSDASTAPREPLAGVKE